MCDKVEIIADYIIAFLLGGNEYTDCVAYTAEPDCEKPITILRSDFFDENVYMTEASLPTFPLPEWHQIPLLFGESVETQREGGLVLHADIVASSFFLMARYEEYVNHENRDIHGRFCGAGSLPGRGGFLERPIVDEYGKALRDVLRGQGIAIKEPNEPGTVYVTHDVDIPFKKWDITTMLRTTAGLFRREHRLYLYPLLNYLGCYKWNPYDTFDWILEQDSRCKQTLGNCCKDIYFLIGVDTSHENTESYIFDKKMQPLLCKLIREASHIGMHLSYQGGACPSEYAQCEKENLEKVLGQSITFNRNHYLRSVNPSDFLVLMQCGITDDFTMGYADRAGFRLGTARCVRWIDAENLEVTELRLHPLIIMECTLTDPQYMGLDEKRACEKIAGLLAQCQSVSGDFCVLFHNSVLMEGKHQWMRDIYQELIDNIQKYWL